MSKAIMWFRDDLRLTDNPALNTAVQQSSAVLPVYVIDERLLEPDRWGFIRTGPYRLQFLLESLEDLKADLQEKGSDLLVLKGLPETVLPELAQHHDCKAIYASKTYTHEELRIESILEEKSTLNLYHTQLLADPDTLPFAIAQTPDVFTDFRKRVEKYAEIPLPLDPPEKITTVSFDSTPFPSMEALGYAAPQQDKRGVMVFKGGALPAYERLDHYFWDTDALATYKQTRNGMIGADYSSKFSPWLANGCISG
ncbi:MAG: deoxyribodipyrimidine photo-lyase, partial [Phaeodactylibacter sp.]|nr:deoxyribodipyrimidine photo-lyase [Phaeodactylibacter sp.]